jgi:hypothetical protein
VSYPVPTAQGFMVTNGPGSAWALAMHCISAHCNVASVHNSWTDNVEFHWGEHAKAGGIRDHHYADLSFDEEKIEAILEEAEAEDHQARDGLAPALYSGGLQWPQGTAVVLDESNWRSVILWLKSGGVHATWNQDPPRLFFGGRLGSFAVPPGWLIILRDGAAEARENIAGR